MNERRGTEPEALEPKAVRVEAAAASLGLGRTTVYGLLASGEIRSLKVGGRRLVPIEALDEFLSGGNQRGPERLDH